MSSRPPWRDIVTLGIVALAVRLMAAVLVGDPAYLDAAYYELVARRLVEGDGFSVPVIWSFLETGGVVPADPSLPVASNRHWMPLTAIVSAGSMAVLGPSRFAAELPHALLGAALVSATAWIGWWLWSSRGVAVIAGLLAIFAGPMLVYVPMVDSFALFGVFGVLTIGCSIRAIRSGTSGVWLLAAGAAAGLATLTRIDGVLLGSAPLIAWVARRAGSRPLGVQWLAASVLVGAAIIAPWLVRQQVEFGSPFPSAGGRLLFITDFNEQFSVTGHPSIGSYLDAGVDVVIGQKLATLVALLGRTTVVLGGIFIAPFLYGLWRERRRRDLAPFAGYWLILLAAMVLLFTLHAPAGAWYHSAWAWLPFAIPMAVANGAPLLDRLSRWLPLFGRPRNNRFVASTAVIGAITLSLIGSAAMTTQWATDRAKVEAAAAFLNQQADPNEVVMYVDPPSLHLLIGNPVVPPTYDRPAVIGDVARAYGVRWVVVERATGATGDAIGLWDGASWLADEPAFEATDIRIYAVSG